MEKRKNKKHTKRPRTCCVSQYTTCLFYTNFLILCVCVYRKAGVLESFQEKPHLLYVYCFCWDFDVIEIEARNRNIEKHPKKKEEYNHPPPCILHIHIWYLFNCAIYSRIVQFSFWFFVENEHPNCLDQNEIERKRIITIIKKKSNYRRRVAICLVRTSAWRSIDFVYPSTYTPVNGFLSNSTHHQCWSITNTIQMFHTNLTNGPSRHASHQKKHHLVKR